MRLYNLKSWNKELKDMSRIELIEAVKDIYEDRQLVIENLRRMDEKEKHIYLSTLK